MHSTLTRTQSLFSLLTTLSFILASLIALTPFLSPSHPTPTATLSLRSAQVVKGRPHYYSTKKEEYAHLKFDLDADLSGLFTWNTKQLFVWVSAVYPSSPSSSSSEEESQEGDGRVNEAVIWDAIIPAPATPFAVANVKEIYINPLVETATDLYASYFPGRGGAKSRSSSRSKSKSKKATTSKSKPGSRSSSPSSSGKGTETKSLTLPGRLSLKNQKPKYQVTDPSGLLSERGNATLQLSWNVQPWVGALVWDKGVLGKRIGTWEAGKSGVSGTWEFPVVKGGVAKKKAAEAVTGNGSGGEGTETEGQRREKMVREEGAAEPVVAK
ncbi:MAG: hypothetical protein Q9227_009424 [Pyrenula ochraceoflavens]